MQLHPEMFPNYRQILWTYGKGNDGKTTFFSKVLPAIFTPDSVHCLSKADLDESNSHSSQAYYNKCMLVIDDLDAPNFLKTSLGKRLSGKSAINVNPKGLKAFTFNPVYNLVVLSNRKPEIELDERS